MAVPVSTLTHPPIVEVVCGLFFPPIERLDPVAIGPFWASIRDEYPHHQVHPAVTDQAIALWQGPAPQRAWLLSADDEMIVQLQPDRFYFNWRKRAQGYPRFGDHEGRRGVLSHALAVFDRFASFCAAEFAITPTPIRVELAKVDMLVEGTHWSGPKDLGTLVPVLGRLPVAQRGGEPQDVQVMWTETTQGIDLRVSIHASPFVGDLKHAAARIETRARREVGEGERVRSVFEALNAELNEVFFGLLDSSELQRFEGTPCDN